MAKRFQLDGTKTAMENLWEAARVATVCVLRRYPLYNKAEERKELFEEIMLRGVQNFLADKVMDHKYNRNYSFIQNVTSSVWQSAGFLINKYIEMTRRRIDAVPLDAEIKTCPGYSVGEVVADTGDNRIGSSYRVIPQPILSVLDRERFGFPTYGRGGSLPISSCPDKILQAVWELDDEDAAEAGLIITIEEKQRREEILKRIPKPDEATIKRRLAQQRFRARQRNKATN